MRKLILKDIKKWKEISYSTKEKCPELYGGKEECCGCSACYAICPVHAIRMQEDKEGFLYPVLDENICIRCYKCIKVCAFKTS